MAELRSAIFIDQLQPQTMCYLGTWIRGRLPRTGMAAAVIEVAPGLDIEPLTDVAIKHTRLQAGILVVERQFGYLEFHSRSTAAVRSASDAVLDAPGAAPAGAIHVARGAVTERKVDEAARTGARLVLGPRAVLTPLAREKARAKGIAIERER